MIFNQLEPNCNICLCVLDYLTKLEEEEILFNN